MKVGRMAMTVGSLMMLAMATGAQAANFPVPFFTGTDGLTGNFTDANGGIWQHFRNANSGGDYSTLFASTWDATDNRWEAPAENVNYETGPTLFTSGDQFNSVIVFETQVAGTFSIDGSAIIDETGTTGSGNRLEVRKFGAGATGPNTSLASLVTGAVDSVWDLGAETNLQSINLLAGERIAIFARKVGADGQLEVGLGGGDPVIISGPAIPEPATLGLIALGALCMICRRSRSVAS